MYTCFTCGISYIPDTPHQCLLPSQYYPQTAQQPAQWVQGLSPPPSSLHDNPLFLALLRRVERLEEKLIALCALKENPYLEPEYRKKLEKLSGQDV